MRAADGVVVEFMLFVCVFKNYLSTYYVSGTVLVLEVKSNGFLVFFRIFSTAGKGDSE